MGWAGRSRGSWAQRLGERGRAGLYAHGDQAGAVTKGGRVSAHLRKTSNEAGRRARSGGPEAGPCQPLALPLLWGPGRSSPFGKGRDGGRRGGPALDYPSGIPEQAGAFTLAPRSGSSPRWSTVSLPWPHWLSSTAPTALSHGWPAPASSAVPFEWPRGALLPSHDPSLCRLASSLLWAGAGGLGPRVLGPPASPGLRGGGAPGEPGPVSPQTEHLTAEQIKE